MIKITSIVGARPQFVKCTAVSRAIQEFNKRHTVQIEECVVHTGQHYNYELSGVFFDELKIPMTKNLRVGSGTHAEQTAKMMIAIEEYLISSRPDCVIVYGDCNTTLAGALVVTKLGIPVVHVEAGERAYDMSIPEEVNRVVADCVSSLLLCASQLAVQNLRAEGRSTGVHFTGDVMYDVFLQNLGVAKDILLELGHKEYYLATIHRPENTNDLANLRSILFALCEAHYPVVLPAHPRTCIAIASDSAAKKLVRNLNVIDPVSYRMMLALEYHARVIITDSGGMQKEASWLGVPCVTTSKATEWTDLLTLKCNVLARANKEKIIEAIETFEAASLKVSTRSGLYGDGHASEIIVDLLVKEYG